MRLMPAIAMILALATGLSAQTRDPGIESVITRQIDAFRAEDLPRAFTFASPMIQQMFRDPATFGSMVRNGYPMVWRPADVTMGDLRVENGRRIQSVILRDMNGQLFIADYEMIAIDGEWRINGVRIRKAPQAGA